MTSMQSHNLARPELGLSDCPQQSVRPELVEGRMLDGRAARFDFAQHERMLGEAAR
ncbi:hypothetical protein [Sphingomonas alba]|uniref:Uncharacterized protein n=1 Tax=Sphingomonas alba TaxID=2908208 RepID=A0ABT0RJB8_9SPHN|nr:hypothetical protein [Sphingomonas alba]MCL6682379.1 hypothetical protein [Sphingomonas alba]